MKLPDPRPEKEEAELLNRGVMVDSVVSKYVKSVPKVHNLTPRERQGVKKLRKRVKNKEIVIYQTDKSGKLCVATPEAYKRQGDKHVASDKVVDCKEIEESQKELSCPLRAYNLMFSAGRDQGEKGQASVGRAKELKSQTIPIMSQLLKDHKKVPVGTDPPTRPVCGGSSSINGEVSE